MKNTILTKSIAILLIVFASAFAASAQAPGSYESEMNYGRDDLKAKNYTSAQVCFELAIAKQPDSADTHFLLGAALLGAKETDKARAEIKKAVALNPSLAEDADELLGEESESTPAVSQSESKRDSRNHSEETLAEYKVGDAVEVSRADRWNPGVVTAVEGSGKSIYVHVKYQFNGYTDEAGFFYNAIRHAASSAGNSSSSRAKAQSNALDMGDYVCEEGLPATGTTAKGYFTLFTNGTYKYPAQGSSGKYEYDAESGKITWLSGYFANGYKADTKFTPGKRVSQIDITFHTKNGELYWSCGHNK